MSESGLKFLLLIWIVVELIFFVLPKTLSFRRRIFLGRGESIATQFTTSKIDKFDIERKLLLEKLVAYPKDKLYLFYAPDFYDYVLFNFHLYPRRIVHVKDLQDRRTKSKNYDYLVILNSKGILDVPLAFQKREFFSTYSAILKI